MKRGTQINWLIYIGVIYKLMVIVLLFGTAFYMGSAIREKGLKNLLNPLWNGPETKQTEDEKG